MKVTHVNERACGQAERAFSLCISTRSLCFALMEIWCNTHLELSVPVTVATLTSSNYVTSNRAPHLCNEGLLDRPACTAEPRIRIHDSHEAATSLCHELTRSAERGDLSAVCLRPRKSLQRPLCFCRLGKQLIKKKHHSNGILWDLWAQSSV